MATRATNSGAMTRSPCQPKGPPFPGAAWDADGCLPGTLIPVVEADPLRGERCPCAAGPTQVRRRNLPRTKALHQQASRVSPPDRGGRGTSGRMRRPAWPTGSAAGAPRGDAPTVQQRGRTGQAPARGSGGDVPKQAAPAGRNCRPSATSTTGSASRPARNCRRVGKGLISLVIPGASRVQRAIVLHI
jgi:hypothetical protein